MIPLELPEIETLRREIEREVIDRKIKSAEAHATKSFPDLSTKRGFGTNLVGAKLVAVERHKLMIVITLSNGYSLVTSFGEHGGMEKVRSKDDTKPETVATITFTQGGDLRILDKDGSSAIQVLEEEDLEALLAEEDPAIDLLATPLSWVEFGRLLALHKKPLVLLLTDPEILAGIGEVYSNEILFDAGLRYDRMSDELSTQEIRRLYRSIVGVMHDAIKHRGTSLEDRPFVLFDGEEGEFAKHLEVYGRAGELSSRSREPIRKTSFKHQPVFFCGTQV